MSQGAEVPTDHLGAFVIGPRLLESGAPGGPLSGLRFGVKDLFDVAGTRTGAGNPDWLADAPVASTDAPAVSALLAAGADLWGKTVTDELAYSLSGTNVHYGTPVNTAAPGHVPGGSSSGSAAAVAGGEVELALGTDTGGSNRVPASYLRDLRPSLHPRPGLAPRRGAPRPQLRHRGPVGGRPRPVGCGVAVPRQRRTGTGATPGGCPPGHSATGSGYRPHGSGRRSGVRSAAGGGRHPGRPPRALSCRDATGRCGSARGVAGRLQGPPAGGGVAFRW